MPLPRPSVALLVGALAATGSAQPASPPRDLPEEARVLLRRDLQFGDSNIDALMRGQIIRKTLDAAH
ncbi:MAG: hypothetical protein HY701_14085, partial [Gemmatimonadetes bacterium]|nr:hypothetical protein [Gemmatimonadota bacterium]